MSVRVTCINKSGGYHADPHHAIQNLGWVNEQNGETGKSTRLEMCDFVANRSNIAYVRDQAGNQAQVLDRISPTGTKYVQTVADGKWTDNLLSLPECK